MLFMDGSNKTILVVDDEVSMREMVSILLKRLGHEVVSARSGEHASASVASSPTV